MFGRIEERLRRLARFTIVVERRLYIGRFRGRMRGWGRGEGAGELWEEFVEIFGLDFGAFDIGLFGGK
jgi:hypothetical protein